MKCWMFNLKSRIVSCTLFAMTIAVVAILTPPALGDDKLTPEEGLALRTTPVTKVFQQANPAVVNISTTSIVTMQDRRMGGLFDEMFDIPSFRRQYKTNSVGSGFFINSDGYLVTNAHVVDQSTECRITLADGTEVPGEQVAIDRDNDLAVLKIKAKKPLPFLRLGRSDDLMPGETVIAIGNPLGYQHTITAGIISALGRDLRMNDRTVYEGLIQTDASINPGNSGGPLLNILGDLIGINTAIRSDAQNIGFAIPINKLRGLLPEMLDVERLRQVQLGIHFDDDISSNVKTGVRIKQVDPNTAAAKAGVKAGDVVTAVDNQPTPNFLALFSLLARTPVGQQLKLDFHGDSPKSKSVELVLAEMPKADTAGMMHKFFGIKVREMNKGDCDRLSFRQPLGLIVVEVNTGTEAQRERLRPGDIITKFGGWPIASMEALGHLIEQVHANDVIPFQVLRMGDESSLRFEVALKARS